MSKRRKYILVALTELIRYGPTAGVVAYYSQDFFQGSPYKIGAGVIFLGILLLLRARELIKKVAELPAGTGLAMFMAVFSGIALIIGEQIFYVSVTYLASIAATLPLEALTGLPGPRSSISDIEEFFKKAVKK